MAIVFNPLGAPFDTVLDQAEQIKYDNTTSGLTATDVQAALDEVQDNIDNLPTPLQYVGTWDASTNTPTLANTDTGKQGFLYQVNVAGTVNFGAGAISFDIGDKVVNNGTIWEKWDHTDAVLSVNGQTGVVSLDSDDVAEGATNLYFTDSRAQGAITGGASSIVTSNLTSNRALQSNGSGKVSASAVTDTELGYVSGVTSAIQTQLGNKAATSLSNLITTAINQDLIFTKVTPQVRSADQTGGVSSEPIAMLSGETEDNNSGDVTLFSGNANLGVTGTSGQVVLRTGVGIESSGNVKLETSPSDSDAGSGSIELITGEVSTGQGTVDIYTPAVNLVGNSSSAVAPEIRLYEGATNGINKVAIKAPNALAADYTLTLPSDDGTNNQVLKTDGSGGLSWTTNIAGNAANVTGTVAIANGGTGQTSQAAAITALAGTQVSGQYLRSDGATTALSAIQAGDVPTLNQNTTGTAANVTGTVAVANGGTGSTSLTANNVLLGNGTSALQVVAPGTSGNVLTSNGTTWASTAPAAVTLPTIQKFTSGSGTYTTPANVRYIKVSLVGGGGGGGASGTASSGGSGGTGGNTTFGSSLLVGNGGVGGQQGNQNGGTGGTASLGTGPVGLAISGGIGGAGQGSITATVSGGTGGNSFLGGGGGGGPAAGGTGTAGSAGQTNTGGGGGGAGNLNGTGYSGSGGGAGGSVVGAMIFSPAASYAYAVGAAGTAGSTAGGGNSGGAGGSGVIVVEEYY